VVLIFTLCIVLVLIFAFLFSGTSEQGPIITVILLLIGIPVSVVLGIIGLKMNQKENK